MKYSIFIIILLAACKKEPGKSNEVVNTVTKTCNITKSENLDTLGNVIGYSLWYYNNDRLDSIHHFSSEKYATTHYEYIDASTRKVYVVMKTSGHDGSYTIQRLNNYHQPIEAKAYDNTGKLINWSRIEYKCN